MGVGSLLILQVVAGPVVVEGSSGCPTPQQVADALAPLLPDGRTVARPDRARLAPADGALEVELVDAAGARLGLRRVMANASCADLAGAAAVIVATWEAELHPGLTAPLSLPASAPPRPLAWEVAAGLTGFYDGVAPAAGASVEASLGRPGLAARVAVSGELPREAPLGPGRVAWTRPALSLGARWRFARGRLRIDLYAEAIAALLVVGGRGFDTPHQDYDFDPGLGGGARLALRFGRVAPWVGVGVRGWLRRQTAVTPEPTGSLDLPRIEGSLSLGVAVGAP